MPSSALFKDNLPMSSHTPREFPSAEAELDDLARRAGAIPGFNARAWESIRMLERIEGRKGYLAALTKAAVTLYDLVRQDHQVQEHIGTGKKVVLGDKEKVRLPGWPRKAAPQALLALQQILHNFAFIASNPLVRTKTGWERRSYIAVPMNRNEFVRGQPYGYLNYEAFSGMIYSLAVASPPGSNQPWLEYIHPRISQVDGRRTRIGPEEAFRTWMIQQELIFPYHPYGQKGRWPKAKRSLLWLRVKPSPEDDREDDVKEPLLRPLQGDERILPVINAQLAKLKIACPLPNYRTYERHYDFKEGRSNLRLSGSKQLYRAFSGEDGRGGRLYGPWVQGVPSALRQHLTINGRPTVELDYGSMQLVLLYAMHGIPVPDGDLYVIPGQLRETMKMVLTVSVGAKTKSSALDAIRKKLQGDNTVSHRPGDAERYYNAFWGFHNVVYPHEGLANQVWAELQYADSQIALRVLRYMLEQNIPAIPIHDSFVVQAQHKQQLEQAMQRAFQDFWPGATITIKKAG
jgi:hypothetical protein